LTIKFSSGGMAGAVESGHERQGETFTSRRIAALATLATIFGSIGSIAVA